MYGSLLTEDTYKRADSIFKSIADEYNPSLKEFVLNGKIHDKNVLETSKSFKACHAATIKIGISATSSPGCKDVGKCIMDITETIQEVHMAKEACIQKFRNDIVYPFERRCEQDAKYIIGLRKKLQDDFKAKASETEKAFASLAKLKKKTLSKPPSKKTDEKIKKGTEHLLAAKTASEMVAHEMLNRAFSEERKRYCFFVEKQCELIEAIMDYHRKSADMLQERFDHWREIGASQQDLLPGAVALIESSLPRHTNVSLDELDLNMGISHSQSSNDLSNNKDNYGTSHRQSSRNIRGPGVRRNASTRVTSSPKEVEVYIPYKNALVSTVVAEDESEENHEDEQHTLFSDESIDGRSSACSSYSKSMYRRSGESEISINSVPSVTDKNETRKSWNDSGISIGEIWNSDQQESHTIKRAKSKSATDTDDESSISVASTVSLEDKRNTPKEQQPSIFEALHDYAPETGSTKMILRRGDRISVHNSKENGGWMYGINKRTNQKGWFPVTYAKKMESHETISTSAALESPNAIPTTPAKFDPNKIRGIAVPIPVLNKPLTKVNYNNNLRSPKNSFGQTSRSPNEQRNEIGKTTDGRNVFQFTNNNTFENIHFRKGNGSPLH
ncbi:BAR/IMD domain-containing adapter protein 2-like [Styela clava]|uniref:brain-specific angiogenesis inhibitor 1-associated protein 2-like protein 1 n=1 Tax=Styela clava TaxID=7725 RepID=UPI0019392A01|nr:brain-specific angiogenesis inhibitor 1-associated protein 2-like protein 1 [Styela clava]